jgi:hypothetical protein
MNSQLPPPSLPAPGRVEFGRRATASEPQRFVVPKRSKHGFHLTMTVLTFGLWVPVWIVCAILNAGRTKVV